MPVSDTETNKGGSFWPLEPYTDQILKRTNLLHSAIESTYCMPKTRKQKLDKNQPKKKKNKKTPNKQTKNPKTKAQDTQKQKQKRPKKIKNQNLFYSGE